MCFFLDICNPQTTSPKEYTADNSNSLNVDRLFVTVRQVRNYGGESVGCFLIPYGGSLKDGIGEWLLKG